MQPTGFTINCVTHLTHRLYFSNLWNVTVNSDHYFSFVYDRVLSFMREARSTKKMYREELKRLAILLIMK